MLPLCGCDDNDDDNSDDDVSDDNSNSENESSVDDNHYDNHDHHLEEEKEACNGTEVVFVWDPINIYMIRATQQMIRSVLQ